MSDCAYACVYQPPAPAAGGVSDRPVSPLAAVAEAFSPRYEPQGDDAVVIDVSGLDRLIGPPRTVGDELRRDAAGRGLRVHVAIAATRIAAIVLAHARPGVTVVDPGDEMLALAPLPIRVLEQIEEEAQPQSTRSSRRSDQEKTSVSSVLSVVNRWGLRTLGELAALPAADVRARLGPEGLRWQAMARGEDIRPLVPTSPDERFTSSIELEWPIDGAEPLSFVLTRLLEPLSARLERRDRGAAALHVHLRLVTKEVHAQRLLLPSPLRDVRTLRTLALLDLETHPPPAAIDHVTVTIDPTPARVVQHTLFTRAVPTPDQLATLLARLGALIGQDRIGAAATIDSYRPGAFAMKPFATDHEEERRGRRVRGDLDGTDRRNADDHHRTHRAHGERLKNDPVGSVHDRESENVLGHSAGSVASALNVVSTDRDLGTHGTRLKNDSVDSVVECDPGNPFAISALNLVSPTIVSALRRCRQPVPARVAIGHDARPVRVTTDRRGFAGGAVLGCAGPWRTSGEWWQLEAAGEAGGWGKAGGTGRAGKAGEAGERGGWHRDEWDVALGDGAVYRIFRDRVTDGWFIDAIVD